MEGRWRAPMSDGSGRDRAARHRRTQERRLCAPRGRLVDVSGTPLDFEITVKNREEERRALAYARKLVRIGVSANVRLLDEVQFQRRRARFDFDMMIGTWTASPSPGDETARPVERGLGQRRRRLQLGGRRVARSRCDDRRDHGGEKQRGIRRRSARARQGSRLRPLRRAALLCTEALDCVFEQAGTPEHHAAVRRRSRRTVETSAMTSRRACLAHG